MSVSFEATGSRQTFFSKPANTTANTVYTCALGTGDTATLEAVNIAVTGASNVTVWVNNGTTDYLLLDAFVMAANTQLLHSFGNPVLRDGWSIKVMTSNADDATFTVVVAEQIR
jgi:flagellar basal body rod protein FlgG